MSTLQNSERQDSELQRQTSAHLRTAYRQREDEFQDQVDDRECFELEASSFNLLDEPLVESSLVVPQATAPSRDYKTTGIANLLRWRSAQIRTQCCD